MCKTLILTSIIALAMSLPLATVDVAPLPGSSLSFDSAAEVMVAGVWPPPDPRNSGRRGPGVDSVAEVMVAGVWPPPNPRDRRREPGVDSAAEVIVAGVWPPPDPRDGRRTPAV